MDSGTVWVVGYEGDEGEWVLDGVFSTRENAVLYTKQFRRRRSVPDIREFTLNPYIESLGAGLKPFTIEILADGKVQQVFRSDDYKSDAGERFEYDYPDWYSNPPAGTVVPFYLNIAVLARDKKHATEIADERRRKHLESGDWPEPYIVEYTGRPIPPRCFSFGGVETFNLPGQHPGWHMDENMVMTYIGEPIEPGTPGAEIELLRYREWKKKQAGK